MTLGLLVALDITDKHLSDIQRIFNTGPYGPPTLVALKNTDKHLSDIQQIFNIGPYGDPP